MRLSGMKGLMSRPMPVHVRYNSQTYISTPSFAKQQREKTKLIQSRFDSWRQISNNQLNIEIIQPQRPFEYRMLIGLKTKCNNGRTGCFHGSHRNDFPLLAHLTCTAHFLRTLISSYTVIIKDFPRLRNGMLPVVILSWHLSTSFPRTLPLQFADKRCWLTAF